MKKIVEKNVAEILILITFILVMSSCSTAQEMTMSNSKRATQCAWFDCK